MFHCVAPEVAKQKPASWALKFRGDGEADSHQEAVLTGQVASTEQQGTAGEPEAAEYEYGYIPDLKLAWRGLPGAMNGTARCR